MWTHAEIEGPCFIATITSMRTGQRNRAAVIECAYELHYYLSVVDDVEVKHVQMMCPPSISGRSHWVLEELESIIMFRGVVSGENAVVYRTNVASYKVGDLDLRRKKEARVLYNIKTLKNCKNQYINNEAKDSDLRLYGALWEKWENRIHPKAT
jgi:hypothetical protein